MKINVVGGVGVGPTELAAFDHALLNAGAANFNLIYLSSVVPPGSDIKIVDKPEKPTGNWGDRLYVVMAQERTSQRNKEVWAGIGWIQDAETKKGLLVEHQGNNEEEVKADIRNSLEALAHNRNMKFGPIHMKVVGQKCEALPICAVAIAIFESSSWKSLSPMYKTRSLPKLIKRRTAEVI